MTNVKQQSEFSKEAIAEAVKEFCSTGAISQRKLARKTGISDATINKIVNHKWEGIKEETWRKLWNAVSVGNTVSIVNTRDYNAIMQACKIARSRKFMIGLLGDTGMGKTTSLKALSRQRNTYYVSYEKTMRAKQFFTAILKEMGIDFDGSIHDMVNKIADELNVQANPLLIIDESGKLTQNVLLYMHVLRDKTDINCGIVLAGMPYFKTNLQKLSNKQKEGMSEFFRRVMLWHELTGLNRAEIKYICQEQYKITDEEDIRAFYGTKKYGDLIKAIILFQEDNLISPIND